MTVHNEQTPLIIVSPPISESLQPVKQSPVIQAALQQLTREELIKEVRTLETRLLVPLEEAIQYVKESIESSRRSQKILGWAALACLVIGVACFIWCLINSSPILFAGSVIFLPIAFMCGIIYLIMSQDNVHHDLFKTIENRLEQNYLDPFYGEQRFYGIWNKARSYAVSRLFVWNDHVHCLVINNQYPEDLKKKSYYEARTEIHDGGVVRVIGTRYEIERDIHSKLHSISQCILEALQREQKMISDLTKTILDSEGILSYLKHQYRQVNHVTLTELMMDPKLLEKAAFAGLISGLITGDPTAIVCDYCAEPQKSN